MRFLSLILTLVILGGCAGAPEKDAIWPPVSGTPESAPANLNAPAGATLLKRSEDGRLWIVGDLSEKKPGDIFYARYSGTWPLQDMARPAFAMGEVGRVYSDGSALARVIYALPSVALEDLEVTWGSRENLEAVGKGVLPYIKNADSNEARLEIGEAEGVQPGDIYGLMRSGDGPIARRLVRFCVVVDAAEVATCQLLQGAEKPELNIDPVGYAVFLEHTYGKTPPAAKIQLLSSDRQLLEKLQAAFDKYLSGVGRANISLMLVEKDVDPTRPDFHRVERDAEYSGEATIVVGVRSVEGKIRANYTGVGPASGPGMIAAPPIGGVVLESEEDFQSFAGTVFAAVQVYRGQTAEALGQIRGMLADPALKGPMRWHLRDQFAMRFAGLGRMEDAIYLIEEDMASARAAGDQEAYLNALGTIVRLHDLQDRPDQALAGALEYLNARKPGDPASYLGALSMYVEMLLAKNQLDEAKARIEEMKSLCPDGCEGDLAGLLSGVYWALPKDARELQAELLATLEQYSMGAKGGAEAAFRVYQGLSLFGDGDIEQGLIAFLEAERLYSGLKYQQGVARAQFLRMMAQISRGEADDALEAGKSAIEIHRQLQDFGQVATVYERLSGLYANLDGSIQPGPWLGAGEHVMLGAIAAASAMGHIPQLAEASFNYGSFLIRVGQTEDSKTGFRRAAIYAIRTARFEIAAMSHLSLAMVARQEGDFETFRDELTRAQAMAKVADDPELMKAIERALMPPPETEAPPTISL